MKFNYLFFLVACAASLLATGCTGSSEKSSCDMVKSITAWSSLDPGETVYATLEYSEDGHLSKLTAQSESDGAAQRTVVQTVAYEKPFLTVNCEDRSFRYVFADGNEAGCPCGNEMSFDGGDFESFDSIEYQDGKVCSLNNGFFPYEYSYCWENGNPDHCVFFGQVGGREDRECTFSGNEDRTNLALWMLENPYDLLQEGPLHFALIKGLKSANLIENVKSQTLDAETGELISSYETSYTYGFDGQGRVAKITAITQYPLSEPVTCTWEFGY